MPEEREIKIPVGMDFVLPDLGGVVEGIRAVDRGRVELSATYWDTDELTLLHAKLGLRHRSAPGEQGKWTLKAGDRMVGDAVSREETDFPGSPDQPPEAAVEVIRKAVGDVALHPVAQLVTDRHSVDLIAGDTRWAEVADDRVSVRSGDATVESFGEVEVELFEADEALIDAVMARLRAAGIGEPDSTPKYVRALRALGHQIPNGQLSERVSQPAHWSEERAAARLTRAALPSVGTPPPRPHPPGWQPPSDVAPGRAS